MGYVHQHHCRDIPGIYQFVFHVPSLPASHSTEYELRVARTRGNSFIRHVLLANLGKKAVLRPVG